MEKFLLITTIVSSVLSLGLIKLLHVLIKEVKDVIETYKKANADGKITEAESQEITKETVEAVEASIKLGLAIKKAFGLIKKN